MTPREFEMVVAAHLEDRGYETELTSLTNDFGVDIFASQGKERLAVQCKMYSHSTRRVNRVPGSFDAAGLRAAGFEGFVPVASLRESGLAVVPKEPGVYVVLRKARQKPRFLEEGTGGRFKDKDPNVDLEALGRKWVFGATVVYVGKAGSSTGSASLRSRLKQLLDFGAGKPVGHYGGRYLWQLRDSDRLLVCWKPSDRPRVEEERLLVEFRRRHGVLPFANLIG